MFPDRIYKYNDDNEVENLSVLYLDFSKTFDTVPHSRLLDKVQNFGIGGKLLKLVHSYLSDRKQVVKIRNTLSTPLAVTSGVPQGSILGPLLFLMFINDLPERFAECFGYADDYKLIFTQQEELENGTKQLEEWCELNEMKLNEKKCSLLVIKGDMSAQLNNVSIIQPSVQRDLGLFVENGLGWNENCSRRSANALKALFKIRRNVTKKCNIQNKIHAYTGYVMPMLTYASQAYHPSIGSLKKLEKVQKYATAWFYGYDISYKCRLIKSKLLPVSLYIELHDVLFLLDLLEQKMDIEHSELLSVRPCSNTRQGDRNEMVVTSTRTKKADENFVIRASQLYNILSRHMKQLNEPMDKEHLLEAY